MVDVLLQTLGHEGVGRGPDFTDVLLQQGIPEVVALHQGHAGARFIPQHASGPFRVGDCPLLRFRVTVPGASHGRAWNLDRDRYERVAREFLERVARLQTPSKKKEREF